MSSSKALKNLRRQRAGRRKAVVGAGRRAQRGKPDMGARAVVAEREAAPADDGLLAADPRDRGRAGAGDDEPPVRPGVSADAGGRRVVRRAYERVAGKGLAYSRRVGRVVQSGEAEADGDARVVAGVEPRLIANLGDEAAHDLDGGGEIDMDVGRRADRLAQGRSPGVPQPRAAARRAAVDADEGDRANHVAPAVAHARPREANSTPVKKTFLCRFYHAPGGRERWRIDQPGSGGGRPRASRSTAQRFLKIDYYLDRR